MWDDLGAGHTPRSEPLLCGDAALLLADAVGARGEGPPPAGRRSGPHGRIRTLHGATDIYRSRKARMYRGGYGLRWPRSTRRRSRRDLDPDILESRSRRDRLRASRPPKAVATYLSVRSGSWTYDLRPGNHAGPPGEAQTAPGRALTLWPLWGRGPGRRIWRVRGRATFGPPRADQDTSWRSSYLLEPERTLTGRWLRP